MAEKLPGWLELCHGWVGIYAAQFPTETEKLVVMDAFLPGVAGWEAAYNHPGIWQFRFNGPTPEALVQGRERTYFDHFWNEFAADKDHSLSEADREAYTAAYARPGRVRAGWAYFVSFGQAAKDSRSFPRPGCRCRCWLLAAIRQMEQSLGSK